MRHHPSKLSLLWIYPASLTKAMDAATWLNSVANLRNSGWRVTLIAVGPVGYQTIRGVEVLCFPRPEVYFVRHIVFHLRVLLFTIKQLESTNVIIFHSISAPWILPLRLVRWFTRKTRTYLVMDSRTLPMPKQEKSTWRDWIRKKSFYILNRLGNHYADGRLVITPRMATALQIPPDKLWGIWPSGVDIEHFAQTKSFRLWPSAKEYINLIYHGSMHYERNLMTLCRAVTRANADGMAFKLSLVGDGTERADLMTYAAQTDQIIRVAPTIAYEDIPELLTQAHMGVLPFPDEEKFRVSSPIKLFEYMAAGLPILATRIVCHTDVIGNGQFAIWAEDASEEGLLNAIYMVWQLRDMLSEMGQRSANAAQEWTWKRSSYKLIKALETGIEKSNLVPNPNKRPYN